MQLYQDLGELVTEVRQERSMRVGLLLLDNAIATKACIEHGAGEPMISIARAVMHLRSSLATIGAIRKTGSHSVIVRDYARVASSGYTWSSIAAVSCHEVVIGAAEAVLEPDYPKDAFVGGQLPDPKFAREPGAIRMLVFHEAMNAARWRHLGDDLVREHKQAVLLPQPSSPTSTLPSATDDAESDSSMTPTKPRLRPGFGPAETLLAVAHLAGGHAEQRVTYEAVLGHLDVRFNAIAKNALAPKGKPLSGLVTRDGPWVQLTTEGEQEAALLQRVKDCTVRHDSSR